MLLPAEIESKTLIPALRAILAKDLSENHNVRKGNDLKNVRSHTSCNQ
ncbi:MAG: hypothetical protein Ct9H300mP17_03690 [Candidatus Nitrosopelagicus sp.]|nr:MAG: hypothetical protein Ct9H300mP17_03690 [Candidatus Nitrosopelagicus sp.]